MRTVDPFTIILKQIPTTIHKLLYSHLSEDFFDIFFRGTDYVVKKNTFIITESDKLLIYNNYKVIINDILSIL